VTPPAAEPLSAAGHASKNAGEGDGDILGRIVASAAAMNNLIIDGGTTCTLVSIGGPGFNLAVNSPYPVKL